MCPLNMDDGEGSSENIHLQTLVKMLWRISARNWTPAEAWDQKWSPIKDKIRLPYGMVIN